jgi:short-subunit dehydrogenase
VRTEFLQSAGMDEDKFAASFPKFLWMPSRDVARIGVEALENDRGIVIAGKRNVLSTRFMQALPRPVLLSTLRRQHPALRRDRRLLG